MKLLRSVLAIAACFFMMDRDRMALAALFDSPIEDCPVLESGASALAMPSAADSCSRPQECAALDECLQCTWQTTIAATGCLDGCLYCDTTEDICVAHSGVMSMIQYTLWDSTVVLMTTTRIILATQISEGKMIGNFSLTEHSEPSLTCTAYFSDSPCLCEYRYCDAEQSTFDLFVDCSAIEGGAMMYGCDKTVEAWNDSWSLMMKMLFFRRRVCLAEPSSTNSTFMASPGDSIPRIDPELIIKIPGDTSIPPIDPERKPSPMAATGPSTPNTSSGEMRVFPITAAAAAAVAVAATLLY